MPGAVAKPRLLVFYSSTQGASRRFDSHLAQVLQRRGNHDAFQITRINAQKHDALVRRFRISALPTLIVVDNNRVCLRLETPRGSKEIAFALQPWLFHGR